MDVEGLVLEIELADADVLSKPGLALCLRDALEVAEIRELDHRVTALRVLLPGPGFVSWLLGRRLASLFVHILLDAVVQELFGSAGRELLRPLCALLCKRSVQHHLRLPLQPLDPVELLLSSSFWPRDPLSVLLDEVLAFGQLTEEASGVQGPLDVSLLAQLLAVHLLLESQPTSPVLDLVELLVCRWVLAPSVVALHAMSRGVVPDLCVGILVDLVEP